WAELTRKEYAVFGVFCEMLNSEGEVWPAVETIMKRAGLERRAVQLALRSLERRALIKHRGFKPDGNVIYRVLNLIRAHEHARDMRPTEHKTGAQACAQTRRVELSKQ